MKLEAEYDRQMKEAQARRGITVRWETALNHRTVAHFVFPKDENELRLTTGGQSCCNWHPARGLLVFLVPSATQVNPSVN